MGSGLSRLARATRPAKNGVGRRRTEIGGRRSQALPSSDVRFPSVRSKQNWVFGRRDKDPRARETVRPSVLHCPSSGSRLGDESNQVERAISTGQLHALPRVHIRPIDVVVFHGSSGRTCFEAGFPLRCLQRLSIPYIATLHRRWRDDRSTRDTFTPVLSY